MGNVFGDTKNTGVHQKQSEPLGSAEEVAFEIPDTDKAHAARVSVTPNTAVVPNAGDIEVPHTVVHVDAENPMVTGRVLFVGGERVGKSTLINLAINGKITKSDLEQPAETCNQMVQRGTTNAIIAYVMYAATMLDSIGLFGQLLDNAACIQYLYSIFFNFRIGIDRVVYVLKHDGNPSQDLDIIQSYTKVLGEGWCKRAILVITHFGGNDTGDPIDARTYSRLNHGQNMRDILNLFSIGDANYSNIIVGSLQCGRTAEMDRPYVALRESMKRDLFNCLNRPITERPQLQIRTGHVRDYVTSLVNYFCLDRASDQKLHRLLTAFTQNKRADCLIVVKQECPICHEDMEGSVRTGEQIRITTCSHIFHQSCATQWYERERRQRRPWTCPVCRQ